MLLRVVLFFCVQLFAVNIKADPAGVKLKIGINNKGIFCHQNETNLKEHKMNAKAGQALGININFFQNIDRIRCVANRKTEVLEWDAQKDSKRKIEVPILTSAMAGVWNCTIVTNKDISEQAHCLFTVNIGSEMRLTLSYKEDRHTVVCEQNMKNLKEHSLTVQPGNSLKIYVNFNRYINSVKCADQSDPRQVHVWNPRTSNLRKEITVPQVTTVMNGVWNCTYLLFRNVPGLSQTVMVNGSSYVAAHCAFSVKVPQACPSKMKLRLSYYNNSLYCDQNITNVNKKEVTIQEGVPLKIVVDSKRYINSIECSDQLDSNRVYVTNPPVNSRNIITVPRIAANMNGIWNCTILTHRNVIGLTDVVNIDGASYVASYCAFRVNVKQSCNT